MIETTSRAPKFVHQDIKCYKLVYVTDEMRFTDGSPMTCKSSVYGMLYSVGEPTWIEELVTDGPYNDVTSGYPLFWNVTSGFASYKEKPVPYDKDMYVAECVIPEGSWVFEDQTGSCFASSRLKIERILG